MPSSKETVGMNSNSFSILKESIRYPLSCPNLSSTCSIRLYDLCRISRIVFTISILDKLSLYIETSLSSLMILSIALK